MNYSYFPGCTLKTKGAQLDRAGRLAAEKLGFSLCEIPEWQCCGAVYPQSNDEIATRLSSVRALMAARDAGQPLVSLCSACHHVLKRVNGDMQHSEDIRTKVNNYLKPETPYAGETRVLHYLEVLRDEIGWDNVRKAVVKPLTGRKIGAYYGCMLLRPSREMQFDDPENPKMLEDFIRAIGAEPVIYAQRNECCGGYMAVENKAYAAKQAQKIMDKPTTAGIGILLTLNTGLRLGELCALQYKDIDLRNGVLHVSKTVQRIRSGDRTCLMVLPPKSDSARRTIPLPGDMAALLKKIIQSHPNGENYLLTGKSAPMEPRTMQYQYRVWLKAAGVPYRNFHVLRHTYASRCVERGVDVKSLSEMLGHADVRTTLQVYVHSSLEHKMRVIQSICFLVPALATEVAPSPSPSDHPEAPRYQQLLTTLSQMG